MKQATKKPRSKVKVKVPKEIKAALKLDSTKYINESLHYTKLKISRVTYRSIMDAGMVRSDILDKVKKHLKIA